MASSPDTVYTQRSMEILWGRRHSNIGCVEFVEAYRTGGIGLERARERSSNHRTRPGKSLPYGVIMEFHFVVRVHFFPARHRFHIIDVGSMDGVVSPKGIENEHFSRSNDHRLLRNSLCIAESNS